MITSATAPTVFAVTLTPVATTVTAASAIATTAQACKHITNTRTGTSRNEADIKDGVVGSRPFGLRKDRYCAYF